MKELMQFNTKEKYFVFCANRFIMDYIRKL